MLILVIQLDYLNLQTYNVKDLYLNQSYVYGNNITPTNAENVTLEPCPDGITKYAPEMLINTNYKQYGLETINQDVIIFLSIHIIILTDHPMFALKILHDETDFT